MNICLKTHAKQQHSYRQDVILQERMPTWVSAPCHLTCDLTVNAVDSYFLVTLEVFGQLTLTCLRCANEFQHEYKNLTTLAVCANDNAADALMDQYECIVQQDGRMNLKEVLTDDLYLFLPEKHLDSSLCVLDKSERNEISL